jgi:hypothetical protein
MFDERLVEQIVDISTRAYCASILATFIHRFPKIRIRHVKPVARLRFDV